MGQDYEVVRARVLQRFVDSLETVYLRLFKVLEQQPTSHPRVFLVRIVS